MSDRKALPSVVRRAEDLILYVVAGKAVVDLPNATLHFPGHAERLLALWDMLDSPRPVEVLLAAFDDEAETIELLCRLTEAGALAPWPLTSRLAQLHGATVVPTTGALIPPATEDARLIREYGGGAGYDLPPAELHADLDGALRARRSVRTFTGAAMSLKHLSTVLQFGGGCNGAPVPAVMGAPAAGRTYPSAGALYPVEVVVQCKHVESLPAGHYSYQPVPHRLVPRAIPARVGEAVDAILAPNNVTGACLVMLLWVDFTRPSLGKYGEKAYRLALLEAGHLAQNVLLVVAGIGLGGVALCGFDDEALARQAGLAYPEEVVVCALALGVPRVDDESHRERQ